MNFNLFSNTINNFKFLQEDFTGISFSLPGVLLVFLYLFFSAGIILMIYLLGSKIRLVLFKENNGQFAPFINIGLGYIFFATGIASLGIFSFLYFYTILAYLFLVIIIGMYPIFSAGYYLKQFMEFLKRIYLEYKSGKWIFIAISLFVFIAFLRLMPPETGEDAISHHTSLPYLYLKAHSIMIDPKLSSSIVLPVPQLGDMLYVLTQAFGIKDASRYVHFAFYIIFLMLLFHVAKNKKIDIGGLSVLLFITAPVVIQVSSKANTDFQWLVCWLLSVILITRRKQSNSSVILSGILFAGVLATKLWTIAFLPVFILYIVLVAKNKFYKVKMSVIFLLFSLLIPSLWYFRAYVLTGSPFYPVFSESLPNPLDPVGLSNYIGFNKMIFNYENILKFSPLFFFGIGFFFYNKLSNIRVMIKSGLFLFFALLSIAYIFMPTYFYPRYLLGLYSIFVLFVSSGLKIIIEKINFFRIIAVSVYFVLFSYYFTSALATLPYGFGWADNNKYLTRILSGDNSSYYDFDRKFGKWIFGKDIVATYGIYGYYYANFSYIDINNTFYKDNRFFDLLIKKNATKLLIKGGDINWFCAKLKLIGCDSSKYKLLASYAPSLQYLYAINNPSATLKIEFF